MKLVIIKSNLREGISTVGKITTENQNLPILKNILIEAEGSGIKLTATNLEIAASCIVPGKIIESGKTTIPAGVIGDILGNLLTERLNIEKKGTEIEIKTDNYDAKIQTTSADDFPLIPKIKEQENKIDIKSEALKDALQQVVISAQYSELRPELNSIYFSFSLDKVTFAATDSFRLSERTIPKNQITTTHTKQFSLLIPLKTAQELLRILKEGEIVSVYHDENQVFFKTPTRELISRLIEGKFPDYEYLIPKKFESEIVMSREEFLSALKLTSAFTGRVAEIKIRADEAKKHIEIFSNDQSLGENQYLLSAKTKGGPKEVSFNWKYLSDGLRAVKGDQVFFGIAGENKPAMLRASNDGGYFYILMPILKA